jgi:hypothetical protein
MVIIKNRVENRRGPMPTFSLFEAVKPSRRVLTNLSADPQRTFHGFGGVYVFDNLVLFRILIFLGLVAIDVRQSISVIAHSLSDED